MSGARRALERIAVASVSWPPASRVLGWLSDLPLPRPLRGPLIHAYARAYGVDLSEAALPPSDYPSFNAFFTRRLRPGVRPIDASPGVVVAPCDSRLSAIGRVPEDLLLEQVKGAFVKAIVGAWHHTWPNEPYPGPGMEWRHEAVRWFDQFLKGEEVFEIRLPSRGYAYRLEPPLPVEVLEGEIKGASKDPILGYVPKPGVRYPGPPPPVTGGPDDRAGGDAAEKPSADKGGRADEPQTEAKL